MRIKNFNEFINEKAISMEDIIKDGTQGVIFNKWTRNGLQHVAIILYDFDDKKILGYIELAKTSRDGSFQVVRSAAEKRYGPTEYDFALMLVNPEGVRPDNVIKPAAQNIWKFYQKYRDDVKKTKIKPGDKDYETSYEIDREHEKETDKEILDLINTVYREEKTDDFKELLNRGQEFSVKYGMDINDIMRKRDDYFKSKYYSNAA